MNRPSCLHCKYWNAPNRKSEANRETVDECRFGPPFVVVHSATSEPASVWPITIGSAWCGQFRKREPLANFRIHE